MSERTEVETKTITYLRAEVASLHAALIALGKNVVNQAQTITDQAQIMRGRLPSEANLPAPVPERTEVETKTITDLRAEVASLHEASTAHGKNVVNQAQAITDQAQIMRGRLPSEANSSPPLVPLRRLPDGEGCELDFLDPAEPAVELEAEPTAGPKAKQRKKKKKKSGSKRA